MEIHSLYHRRFGCTYLWRSVVCRRCYGHRPQPARSKSIIGLPLIAGGTSLPELATSIVTALKKNPEIAIGNVIGSNLFNIFFILGCRASITPLHLSGITHFYLSTLVGSSILLWLFGLFFAKRTITRIEGGMMILCYVAYTVVLIYNTCESVVGLLI